MADFKTQRGFEDNWRPPAKVRKVITPLSLPLATGGGSLAGVKARMARIASRAPEVMVKITGRTYSADHVKAHLDYISRNGKLELECDGGDRMIGRRDVHDLADSWGVESAIGTGRKNSSTSISVVFSMPPGTDPDKLRDAVRSLARTMFEGKHDYAMALHTDGKHPHVHLTLRSTGHDGQRLNPRKADLAQWRQVFAERLRERGIEAEATPRRARGVVRKAERMPVRKARERFQAGRGKEPSVTASARHQVTRDVLRPSEAPPRPWEDKIAARQTAIRKNYIEGAKALARSQNPSDVQLARDIHRFVSTMPPPVLQRHILGQQVVTAYRERGAFKTPERAQDAQAVDRLPSIKPDRDRSR
ncbi:relaxase/mobilization nuclease domain-containing protein [Aureimonas sp. N4]|uniref:relaxase/mobilization nuclease domain-containing protein n=1 Tax=Aureimonas sp. N4 TaxID=1638165 RepID=UPI0009EB6E21|nr:relaxase/mobilization nuclease domain-containing protein [Aureimonas sp. N4]